MEFIMEIFKLFLILLFFIGIILFTIWIGSVLLGSRARALGFDSTFGYLRAIPANDAQKLDATDLALKGTVLVFLGVLFGPLILVGLVPLYYGYRKIILSLMGMGLDQTSTD